MDPSVLSFKKVNPNKDLIDEIWSFDVKNIDSTSEIIISKYIIALGQWLIYYRAQINDTKAQISQLTSDIEFLVATWMTSQILKEHKTQTAARDYLIRTNPESSIMRDKISKLKQDLIKVEGIDKAVIELIAAFKRDLTRRDNELYTLRKERYGK
jgi:hypothetical protein